MTTFLYAVAMLLHLACSKPEENTDPTAFNDPLATELGIPIERINLPKGYKIMIAAHEVENARQLEYSPTGTLFVGSRRAGNVYALRDTDGDYRFEEKTIIASGLNQPNGVAFHQGDLYVAEIGRILKFPDIENNLISNAPFEVVTDLYPEETHHGWKYIAFGPDNKLYVPVGAPCNICESDSIFASLTKINPDGSGFEIVQYGIRNTVGFTWHPDSEELWFTDNGRDWMGDDLPACELNHAPQNDMHFGYPYCHQGDLLDPDLGDGKSCSDYTAPAQNLGPHVAPLGLEFYTGKLFDAQYKNDVFIAEHGSWNRSAPIGYRVTLVELDAAHEAQSYTVFADGWLNEDGSFFGRPVDLELLPDGSMLVSDDYGGIVYRIFR